MNTQMIIDRLNQKQNGAFFNVRTVSDIPMLAAAKRMGHTCYKETVMTVRKGISYKNMKAVKDKIALKVANGEITQAEIDALDHKLPWGAWKAGSEGLIIEHKGQNYVRLYSSPNKAKVRYFLDGVEVTYDALKNSGVVQPSYFNKSGEPMTAITLKAENIMVIY